MLPRHFKHSRLTSFVQQLHHYGFHAWRASTTDGPADWSLKFMHHLYAGTNPRKDFEPFVLSSKAHFRLKPTFVQHLATPNAPHRPPQPWSQDPDDQMTGMDLHLAVCKLEGALTRLLGRAAEVCLCLEVETPARKSALAADPGCLFDCAGERASPRAARLDHGQAVSAWTADARARQLLAILSTGTPTVRCTRTRGRGCRRSIAINGHRCAIVGPPRRFELPSPPPARPPRTLTRIDHGHP